MRHTRNIQAATCGPFPAAPYSFAHCCCPAELVSFLPSLLLHARVKPTQFGGGSKICWQMEPKTNTCVTLVSQMLSHTHPKRFGSQHKKSAFASASRDASLARRSAPGCSKAQLGVVVQRVVQGLRARAHFPARQPERPKLADWRPKCAGIYEQNNKTTNSKPIINMYMYIYSRYSFIFYVECLAPGTPRSTSVCRSIPSLRSHL